MCRPVSAAAHDLWGAMPSFILAYSVFLLVHDRRLRNFVQTRASGYIGAAASRRAYSVLSVAVLYWVLRAASTAPHVELWPPAPWQHHLALATMPLALAFVALGSARANPFSISYSSAPFCPETPGVLALTRHPILVGIGLWALVHVPPNGDAVHLFLFGSFAMLIAIGIVAFDRLRRREIGEDAWARLAARTALFAPWRLGAAARGWAMREWIAILAAGAAYLAFILFLHAWLFGVSPQVFF